LKPKKTLSDRLTTRYQLVIRNEENLSEKTTLAFTYAKVLVFSVVVFVVLFGLSLFLAQTLLAKWYDPRHAQLEANKQLFELALKLDSLALEEDRKTRFIQNFQRILSGDTAAQFVDPAQSLAGEHPVKVVGSMNAAQSDSIFRKEFEKSQLASVTLTSNKYRELQQTFFFTPITGYISDHYDVKKGHFGIDVVAKKNEPVKCIADGTVIIRDWTQESGYVIAVQHSGNLISIYKHNAELLKKVGTFVNAGEIISIVGNSGEMTDGPHLHFELWYNGSSLNPEEFVTF
jgi:murein DD-endopeptidase MepM/ murein hydrolase activator NlpD